MQERKIYKKRQPEQPQIETTNFDFQLEKSILGAVISEKNALQKTIDFLQPETFFSTQNQLIYNACLDLYSAGKSIDSISVAKKLRGIVTATEITDCTIQFTHSFNLERDCLILKELEIKRKAQTTAQNIITQASDGQSDPFELVDSAVESFLAITQNLAKKKVENAADVMAEFIKNIGNEINDNKICFFGYADLDFGSIFAKIVPQSLIIIAARPAMGKTAFALNIAKNAVFQNIPTAFFSLEMSNKELAKRLIVSLTEIENENLNNPENLTKVLQATANFMSKKLLFIDDTPAITLTELRSKIQHLVVTKGVKMVFIDYLQLMVCKGKDNRTQEVGAISRGLKAIAKEFDICIFALSQLNRGSESRANKRPFLSDLRESGEIEQDADMVMFLHREEYYNILTDEQGNSTIGMADLIVAKHRNGNVGDVKLSFVGKYFKFETADYYELAEKNNNLDNPF